MSGRTPASPTLARALRLQQQGQLAEAGVVYERALREKPRDPETLYRVGVFCLQGGQPERAVELLARCLKAVPRESNALLAHAMAARQAGDPAAALASVERALTINPGDPDLLKLAAEIHAARGDQERALAMLRKRALTTRNTDHQCDLAEALLVVGRADEARTVVRKTGAASPGHARPRFILGQIEAAAGQPDAARQAWEAAAALDPGWAAPQVALARQFTERQWHDEAIDRLQRFLKAHPASPEGWRQLARILREQGRYREAIEAAGQGVTHGRQETEGRLELARSLADARRPEEALATLEALPDAARALPRVAIARLTCLQYLGRADEAGAAARELIQKHQLPSAAHALLRTRRPRDLDDPDVRLVEQWIAERELGDEDRATLLFALGEVLDRAGRTAEAFERIDAANRIMHRLRPVHLEAFEALARAIADFAPRKPSEPRSLERAIRPILIVGLPRSGTTLLESRLALHPQLAAGGELKTINGLARSLTSRNRVPHYLAALDSMDPAALAERYQGELAFVAQDPDVSRVTDKYPLNFWFLEIVRRMDPGIPIIAMRRHPLDLVLSNYFQYFTDGNGFAFDLAACGRYFGLFQKVMDAWKTKGLNILDVRYEDLVSDPAATLERVCSFAGVDFQPGMVDGRTEGPVQTASLWQVRGSISSKSVGRWRPYAAHLAPVATPLAPWLDAADLELLGGES